MNAYYSAVIVGCLITLAVLTVLVWENNRISKSDKKLFYFAYAVIAAAALAEWTGVLLNTSAGLPIWILKAVKCADYILTPLAGWALIQHMKQRNTPAKILLGVLALNTVFQLVSAFTGWMTIIDKDGHYSHGPLYHVYIVIYLIIIALVLTEFILYGKAFRRQNRVSLYLILVLIVSCICVQEFTPPEIRTAYIGLTVGAALLFTHYTEFTQLISDEEIARQHSNILVLQMRPHFIYNTMTSIYYLCASDSKKAQQVTLDFTEYLRRNFTAITHDGVIPFKHELEHAKAYLEVEKAHFEDQLFVEFDLRFTEFQIPPLTLQPIVENAVKHGVSPGLKPLHISVTADKTDNGSEIIVEDTGPGFGKKDNNEPHVALKNIRERLEMMCKGTLTVNSSESGGTVVRVFIPSRTARKSDDSQTLLSL